MKRCKYCEKEKSLVKSHIIPRSFFEIKDFNRKAPKKSLSLLSDSGKINPMKHPIGIYDIHLFCKECENKFMKYDDYAFKLLNEQRENRKTQKDEMCQVKWIPLSRHKFTRNKVESFPVLPIYYPSPLS